MSGGGFGKSFATLDRGCAVDVTATKLAQTGEVPASAADGLKRRSIAAPALVKAARHFARRYPRQAGQALVVRDASDGGTYPDGSFGLGTAGSALDVAYAKATGEPAGK